jgi:hypothetical protein
MDANAAKMAVAAESAATDKSRIINRLKHLSCRRRGADKDLHGLSIKKGHVERVSAGKSIRKMLQACGITSW